MRLLRRCKGVATGLTATLTLLTAVAAQPAARSPPTFADDPGTEHRAPAPVATPTAPPRPAPRAERRAAATALPDCSQPDLLGTARTIEIDPRTGPIHLGLKTYPQTLALHDHEVVLTFDDGPSPRTTPAVLDALQRECVHATFFLIGRNARADPALVRRESREGHAVGHHSMTHPAASLRFLPDAMARRDIDEGIAADEQAGWPGAPLPAGRPHVPFFRFPGFADTPALLAHLDAAHISVFGCDLWAGDWNPMTPQQEVDTLMGRLDRIGHRGIILLHDTIPSTAAMLPAFLRALKTAGYQIVFVTPGEGTPPPAIERAPAGWSSETDAIITRRGALLRRAATRAAGAPDPASPAAPMPAALPSPAMVP